MRNRMVITTLLLLSSVGVANARTTGSIKGLVVDEVGKPVKLASVLARDIESSPSGLIEVQMGAVPWVQADEQGQFIIRGLAVGHRYKLYTKKEEDGYPDTTIPTYNPNDDAPTVVASDAPRSSSDIRLQMGPKAVVFSYDLNDAVTGKPIQDYTITVTRVDTDYSFSGVNRDNRVLLPADTDMNIKFEVKGYQPWYYPGHTTKEAAAPVRGSGGEERHISILLTPETGAP